MARNIPKLVDDIDDITTYGDESFEAREELIPNAKANKYKYKVHTPHFYVNGHIDENGYEDDDGFYGGINIEERCTHDMDGWDDEKDCDIGDIGHNENKVNSAGRTRYKLPSRLIRELRIDGDFDE